MMGDKDSNCQNFLRTPISGSGFGQTVSSSSSDPADTGSKTPFLLRPSLLTATAEKLRTDKPADSSLQENSTSTNNLFLGSARQENASDNTNPFLPKDSGNHKISNGNSVSSHNVLGLSSATNASSDSKLISGGFVFGQNISSRVVNADDAEPSAESAAQDVKEFKDISGASSGGNVRSEDEDGGSDSDCGSASKVTKSLTENAKEYQDRQVRPEFEEVHVVTGEEGEANVLQLVVKAFIFDKEKGTWLERGRGYLHLNDISTDSNLETPHDVCEYHIKSRVIMRVQGSLKVVINTFIWPDMTIQMPNEKSVRLSAQTDDGIKVFLLLAHSPADADMLYNAINGRKMRLIQFKASQTASQDRRKRKTSNTEHAEASSTSGGNDGESSTKKTRKGSTGGDEAVLSTDPASTSSDSSNDSTADSSSLDRRERETLPS